MAIIMFTSCATAQPAASPATVVNTPTATLTVYTSTPTPTRPVLTNTPTSTLAAPTPTPTEAPVPIALVEERMVGDLAAELAPLDVVESHIDRALFNAMNPGQRLLVPEGLTYQGYTNLTYEGQLVAVMNVNVPLYRPRPLSDPAINRLEADNLITWEDNEGNLLYHVPMAAANEGLAPVVLVNEKNQLQFGWVDSAGKLDPDSIADYWQAMPAGAVRAVMAKYVPDNTVYATFWDRDSNELEEEGIKVVELPASPTPTPEVVRPEAINIAGLNKVWNDRAGRWEYIDSGNQNVAFWNASANGGKGRIELASGLKSLDLAKDSGLFVGWTPQQAEAATLLELKKGNIAYALPFDPTNSGGIIEERAGYGSFLCFRSLRKGIIVRAPVSGTANRYGLTSGVGMEIGVSPYVFDFIFPKGTNFASVGGTIKAGSQITSLSEVTLPADFGYLGTKYQFILDAQNSVTQKAINTSLNNLLRDESGMLVYVYIK
jgi:hypothetical protein